MSGRRKNIFIFLRFTYLCLMSRSFLEYLLNKQVPLRNRRISISLLCVKCEELSEIDSSKASQNNDQSKYGGGGPQSQPAQPRLFVLTLGLGTGPITNHIQSWKFFEYSYKVSYKTHDDITGTKVQGWCPRTGGGAPSLLSPLPSPNLHYGNLNCPLLFSGGYNL